MKKAILAIEEALLSALFMQKALIELLMKKGIIKREELEEEALRIDTGKLGIGEKGSRLYLLKRSGKDRRQINKRIKKERRKNISRRN